MRKYKIIFTPRMQEQIADFHDSIREKAGLKTADRYIDGLRKYCMSFKISPERGTLRDDIHNRVRITNYRSRITLAFTVDSGTVTFHRLFHAGQDIDALLSEPEDD